MDLDKDADSISPRWSVKPWSLVELKRVMTRWQKELEGRGWNSQYLSNHDLPRAVSRFGDDGEYRVESAKLLAIFLHLLQGTPYIYQGEIGMTNVTFGSIGDYRDVETLRMYREFVSEKGMDPALVIKMIYAKGRDNARTPVQWSPAEQAGFTTGTPWLGVNPNYREINVEAALENPNSIFYTCKRLIELRKELPVMTYGRYDLLLPDHEEVYAFTRTLDETRLLVVLNFSAGERGLELPGIPLETAELLLDNYPEAEPASLRAWEARVYRLA